LIAATYVLQNVQLGSLNFTMLVLNPPTEPLVYTLPSDVPSIINVCVLGFNPTIDILDTINADAVPNVPPVFEFTASNLARMKATPTCTTPGDCTIVPYLQEWYTGAGAYSVQPSTSFPGPGDLFLEWLWQYNTGNPDLGTNYTIAEPLMLVLPSS
jgi:hypothetical protein